MRLGPGSPCVGHRGAQGPDLHPVQALAQDGQANPPGAEHWVVLPVLGGVAAELVLRRVQEADYYRVGRHGLQYPNQVGPLYDF